MVSPRILAAAFAAIIVLPIMLVVLVFAHVDSAVAADYPYQCDSALGPDPSSTLTYSAPTLGDPEPPASDTPTANPYAPVTGAVDARGRACETAMRAAPLQAWPKGTTATGVTVDCAHTIIVALMNRPGSNTASSRTTVEPAAVTAAVIRQASSATTARDCTLLTPADISNIAAEQNDSSARATGPSAKCPVAAAASVVVLPTTIAAQSFCGQRVDPAAVSSGDLVFWDYQNNAPQRVALAVGATNPPTTGQKTQLPSLQVAVWDPASGQMTELTLPNDSGIRVKRFLGSTS
ncbi:hypothetical protein [Nocardia sp. NBC_01327]|uniref:hypothetical protein n=1 Tax=Nocardia sp. NBC_01327 TaxID=2903593 RepID=UPI002E14E5E3|nr:hypothetical protein OG326_41705 [Nocardia sp. NBC_01327]